MELSIHAISDTHNHHKHFVMPGGDILIHAGDGTGRGRLSETLAFLSWFADQDYSNLIFIPGNHDFIFEQNPTLMEEECKNRGITLLHNSGVEVQGIKIWGSATTPTFLNWAFMADRGPAIKKHWDLIPEDTEILITHGPANGILDYIPDQRANAGCADLLSRIFETQVKLHISGHIHEGRGNTQFNDRLFVNAAVLDGQYRVTKGNPTKIIRSDTGIYSIQTQS